MPTLATNPNAKNLYTYQRSFEAGLKLIGPEVKSVKKGRMQLKGSYIRLKDDGTAHLIGAHIAPYEPARGQYPSYDPNRQRQLLLKKSEIRNIRTLLDQYGNATIVPDSVFTKGGIIKINIAVATGKKKYDKREKIKKKEEIRSIRKNLDA